MIAMRVSRILANSSARYEVYFFYSMSCTNKFEPVKCNAEVYPRVAIASVWVAR